MFFGRVGNRGDLELNACLFTKLLLVTNSVEEGNESVIVVGSSSRRGSSRNRAGQSSFVSWQAVPEHESDRGLDHLPRFCT
jgi:hypothetical protein